MRHLPYSEDHEERDSGRVDGSAYRTIAHDRRDRARYAADQRGVDRSAFQEKRVQAYIDNVSDEHQDQRLNSTRGGIQKPEPDETQNTGKGQSRPYRNAAGGHRARTGAVHEPVDVTVNHVVGGASGSDYERDSRHHQCNMNGIYDASRCDQVAPDERYQVTGHDAWLDQFEISAMHKILSGRTDRRQGTAEQAWMTGRTVITRSVGQSLGLSDQPEVTAIRSNVAEGSLNYGTLRCN
ncbi:hypothetical protein G6F57_017037 [Rhizopus arrhizus]|nr:hypothetical protein G6F57_017037 [Rhizopus arrhizus]